MITLWRKYSYVILFCAVTLAFGLYLAFSLSDDDQENSYLQVEVQEGDSLWSLSRDYAEALSMSENEFIKWVASENKLLSYSITKGDKLLLPISTQDEEKFIQNGTQLASEK